MGEKGVDVELDDLGMTQGHLVDPLQRLDDRIPIDGGGSAVALEKTNASDRLEHLRGIGIREWSNPEYDVLPHLDCRAAQAECHQRAERAIAGQADESLHALPGHLLDDDAFHVGLSMTSLEQPEPHALECLPDRFGILQAEPDTPDVGLVSECGRDELERDGEADRLRGCGRFVRSPRHRRSENRNAPGSQNLFDSLLWKPFPLRAGAQFLFDDRVDHFGLHIVEGPGGSLLSRQPLPVIHGSRQSDRRRLGKGVGGDSTSVKRRQRGRHSVGSHETGQHRLVGPLRSETDRVGDFARLGHDRRNEQDDHRIELVAVDHQPESLLERFGRGAGNHVHGIPRRCFRRQKLRKLISNTRRQLRHDETSALARVGSHDSRTTRVGQNPHSVSAGNRLIRQKHRHVEELFDRVGADDSGLAQECADGNLAGSEGSGMRAGSTCSRLGPAALDHGNRLPAADSACDLHEPPGISEALEIEQDDLRRFVLLPVLEEIVA